MDDFEVFLPIWYILFFIYGVEYRTRGAQEVFRSSFLEMGMPKKKKNVYVMEKENVSFPYFVKTEKERIKLNEIGFSKRCGL